jgi:hypothetical protein
LTLSHPAAVLPLRRLGLPMTAMVIGSMVLDVPLYLGSRRGYDIAHSPAAVPTVDIVGALIVLALWFAVLRDPLADLAPSAIRNRVAPRARPTRRQWVLAPLGAFIGGVTHVAWDSFTHADRWGTEHIGWLKTDHLGVSGLRWSQYVSAVGGLIIVCAFAVAHLRTLPVIREPRPARVLPAAVLPSAIAVAVTAGLVSALGKASVSLHSMAFHGAVSSVITLAAGIVIMCAGWQLLRQRSREPVDEA